jgi:urease beta subunit
MKPVLYLSTILLGAAAAAPLLAAEANPPPLHSLTEPPALPATTEPTHEATDGQIRFSDPAKPGRLKIYVAQGDLTVRGDASSDAIAVQSKLNNPSKKTKYNDGLRVLSDTASSFLLFEKNNVAEFSNGKDSWPTGEGANFEITVPANTALEIQNGWNGSVKVERVTGDVEIKGLNCEVKLTDLGGGAIVETMNGEITASFAALPDKKPVSFSSMNGEVKLRVPADAKANVRFRTHNGAILTDFADDVLKTKAEDLGRTDWGTIAGQHIAMAAQIGSQVGREVTQMAREVAAEAQSAVREARAETRDRAAEKAENSTGEAAPAPKPAPRVPHALHPPLPPSIPAIAGGKVVSGTLNGGGIEIQVTTMNGDITLRKQP